MGMKCPECGNEFDPLSAGCGRNYHRSQSAEIQFPVITFRCSYCGKAAITVRDACDVAAEMIIKKQIEADKSIRSKQTNFERIKAMGADELSRIIMCPYFRSEPCGNGKNCNKCCKEWLESEVEEDE